MITLYLFETLNNLAWYIINKFFDPLADILNMFTQYVQALTIPVVFSDILHICIFFLPTQTIFILFCITTTLISLQIVHSIARWIIHLCGLI